jgi:hypothetical protein
LSKRKPRGISVREGMPMETALTPAECRRMRGYLRGLVTYHNHGGRSVSEYIAAVRENNCGYRRYNHAGNTRQTTG